MSERLVGWHGRGTRERGRWGSIGGNYMFAGDRGYGDTEGPTEVETFQHVQSRAWIDGSVYGPLHGAAIGISHYAAAVFPGANECYVGWNFESTDTWSFRYYLTFDGAMAMIGSIVNPSGQPIDIVSFWGDDNTTKRGSIALSPETLNNIFESWRTNGRQVVLKSPGKTNVSSGLQSSGGYQISGNDRNYVYVKARIEGRCVGGVLTVSVFEANPDLSDAARNVPRTTLSIVLDEPEIDNISFGCRPASTDLRPLHFASSIEIWDDSDEPDAWPRGQYAPLPPYFQVVTAPGVAQNLSTDVRVVTGNAPLTTRTVNLTNLSYIGESREESYSTYPNIAYAYAGGYPWLFDLHVPNENVFPGPHPLVIWIHGGFFSGGSRLSLDPNWVRGVTQYGYAVATVDYPLVTVDLVGNNFSGKIKHPAQIAYLKRSLTHMKDEVFCDEYNIDPNKTVMSGHSAGGFLALAVAYSEGLSSVNGFDLRGEAWLGDGIADAAAQGVFVYAAPVSWQQVRIDNGANFAGTLTPRSYMGRGLNESDTADAADIMDFITGNEPPTAYVAGSNDVLVTPTHATILGTRLGEVASSSYDLITVTAGHDNVMFVNTPSHPTAGIVPWLNDLFGGAPEQE